MRVNGDRGAQPLECINPPKDRWAVRWDFRDEKNGISYEEKVFDHEPTSGEMETAIAERIDGAKAELLARIAAHDKSGAVNGFRIALAGATGDNIVEMWLSREERSALRIRFEAEQRAGVAVTTLWAPGGLSLTITPELGLGMLYALELYAAASYDRTQQHLLAAAGLGSVAECEAYDYAAGYPEKLTFQINP
jgi:hypothetical protein